MTAPALVAMRCRTADRGAATGRGVDALAGGELARGVLARDALLAAAQAGLGAARLEVLDERAQQ